MNIKSSYFSLIYALSLISCTSTTEVQLYTEYLSTAETNNIEELLKEQNYNVVLNNLPIPNGIYQTTLIYSPLNRDIGSVEFLVDIISNTPHGRPRLELTGKENHFYSRKVVGLYIVPHDVVADRAGKNPPAYAVEYSGRCETADADLDVKKDGTFRFTSYIWDDEKQTEYSTSQEGHWNYTDKTLFLTLEGHEPVGFSVSRFEGDDRRRIKLRNSGEDLFYDDCYFDYTELVY